MNILLISIAVVALANGQYERIQGQLTHITASVSYLWGVNHNDDIFICTRPCSSTWTQIGGKLIQVDADDTEVWGVNSAHNIFRRPVNGIGGWIQVPGRLAHVSASGNGYIWGVNKDGVTFKCQKPCNGGAKWRQVDGNFKQIDGGSTYVYVVNRNNDVFRRPVDGSKEWLRIRGMKMKHVTGSGTEDVFGIDKRDRVYRCKKPCTGNWELMSGRLSQCDATFDGLVGVNRNRAIFRRNIGV